MADLTNLDAFLFSPAGLVLLFVLLAAWLVCRPRARAPRVVLIAVTVFFALASTYAVSHLAGTALSHFESLGPAGVPKGRTIVVLLGGSSLTAQGRDGRRLPILASSTAMRTLEAFRVYEMTDAASIVTTGGNQRSSDSDIPAGDSMKDALVALGVPETRILIEKTTRSTRDEALAVARLLPALNSEHVILVTTELHMRRALGAFNVAGVRAIPAAAREPQAITRSWRWYVPTNEGFREAAAVVHELLGLAYYKARGWW